MASLERRGDKLRIVFRFAGRKYQHPVGTGSEREANAVRERLEENLRLLERGRLTLPPDADLPTFLVSDGKLNAPPEPVRRLTLGELRDRYLQAVSGGSLEANTLSTTRTHFRHIGRLLGPATPAAGLTLLDLQEYVDRRASGDGRHFPPVAAVTIKKELATLRAAWNWAALATLVTGTFPGRGLRYPSGGEKPPFRTFGEVSERVRRGRLSVGAARELWDCVFLSRAEVEDLLAHVRAARPGGVEYPMCCFAAMTGARRSELLRLTWDDVDLAAETVVIREKKRVRGRRTTRRVALAPPLVRVLGDWRAAHPGGEQVFCWADPDGRPVPVDRHAAETAFNRAVAGSRWRPLRGWHVFRHSFVSNCAALGVDQRVIDEWVGHTTDEMRRRYRHLIPSHHSQLIRTVFG